MTTVMSRKGLNPKTTMMSWVVVFVLLFCVFVIYYQKHMLAEAAHRIDNHARIVASSLWTFDRVSPLAYLNLAAEANGYLNITVYDGGDAAFLVVEGVPLSGIDRLMDSLRLIQIHLLESDIIFEGRKIGRIVAEWPNRAIYWYFNIFFWIILVLIGVALLLKLLEAKQSLESRVQERTAELENEIKERQNTEEALRAQTQRLTLHVMNTPLGVIEWNLDFRIVEWNKAAEHIFGYSKEEALGKTGYELILPERVKTQITSVWQQLISHSGGSRSVNENLTKSGKLKTCEWYNTTLTDQEGRVVGVASLVMDISDRKRAEEENRLLQAQLLQAQKMEAVGNLAGGIAHDFNNILQTITGNTQLLLIDAPEDDLFGARLRSIEMGAKRAAELIRQLLTFSRKIESNLLPLDLNQEINQMRGMLERTIPKMITIDLKLDDQLKMIRGDTVQFEQILLNLAINAMQAMPNGGRLIIRTENVYLSKSFCRKHLGARAQDYVKLSVSDTGEGIDEDTIAHIFEPFFTTKAVGRGTGLGLSIVYGIVKNHQGFIECSSVPGSGTTFIIYFPVVEEAAQEKRLNPENAEIIGGTETILIIDDEESIQDIGREILTAYGYTVLCAGTGEDGLEIYKEAGENKINLIVLDLNMPGMGGLKCLQKIRAITPDIPILIASGYTPTEVVQNAMSNGANGVIAKPFQLFELLQSIRDTIDKKMSEDVS